MQAEFVHAGFHARGHVAGTGGVGGHGQAADGGFNAASFGIRRSGLTVVRGGGFGGFLGGKGQVQAQAGDVFVAGIEVARTVPTG